ncbi:SOS-response transcriptional repressor LexA [Actinoplanes campanulatus]|uniref:SOS-response transcriptional repressor LexA n=1 Tax=Actinoplanes campanulatus TaxID=113559 RepID=A0A7W5FHZ4_9ACTN|nr:helix-turn-helix domain-containing protein [Actinoplanes campanulatus]MBB3098950.1 SOS-response transcriptional repressor LexA [Actinoplanes campanulatus]
MTAVVLVPLTPVQQRVLAEIRGFVDEYGYAPTLRELAARCGRGPSTVAYQLQQLEEKGRIRRYPKIPRALVVLDVAGGS